jgi:aspartyl-tRNA(Asn)/glutamyl-tRNA(Gln) amidotransferase subunit A
LLLETISGHDAKDSTSLNEKPKQYNQTKNNKLKIGIIQEAFGQGNDKEIESQVLNTIAHLEDHGIKTEKISLPNTIKYGLETYYMIATSEASTNLQRYCGMRYGAEDKPNEKFNEYFTKIRSKNLGDEAKRRIILGTFARMSGYRDAYYIKAMQVRTLIINEYKKAFKKFDLLISPSTPVLPPKIKEAEKLTPLQNYMMDTLLVGPNLAGLPHLNVPVGMANNLPVGALFIANHLEEEKLIQIGNYFN